MNTLCTIEDLKDALGISQTETSDDAVLTGFLEYTTSAFEAHCHRKFAFATETQESYPPSEIIHLSRPPIIGALTLLEYRGNDQSDWEDMTTSIPTWRSNECTFIRLGIKLRAWPGTFRLTYDGGYILPPDTAVAPQLALPAELTTACRQQAVWFYTNRAVLGTLRSGGEGGTRQFQTKTELLQSVVSILKKFQVLRP